MKAIVLDVPGTKIVVDVEKDEDFTVIYNLNRRPCKGKPALIEFCKRVATKDPTIAKLLYEEAKRLYRIVNKVAESPEDLIRAHLIQRVKERNTDMYNSNKEGFNYIVKQQTEKFSKLSLKELEALCQHPGYEYTAPQ